MASDNNSGAPGGIGGIFAVFLVFLVLKLCHVIDWSWWWVTAPLWIPLAVVLTVFAVVLFVAAVSAAFSKVKTWYGLLILVGLLAAFIFGVIYGVTELAM